MDHKLLLTEVLKYILVLAYNSAQHGDIAVDKAVRVSVFTKAYCI